MREREGNLVETKSVGIPCLIGSFDALRPGDLLVLVKILFTLSWHSYLGKKRRFGNIKTKSE